MPSQQDEEEEVQSTIFDSSSPSPISSQCQNHEPHQPDRTVPNAVLYSTDISEANSSSLGGESVALDLDTPHSSLDQYGTNSQRDSALYSSLGGLQETPISQRDIPGYSNSIDQERLLSQRDIPGHSSSVDPFETLKQKPTGGSYPIDPEETVSQIHVASYPNSDYSSLSAEMSDEASDGRLIDYEYFETSCDLCTQKRQTCWGEKKERRLGDQLSCAQCLALDKRCTFFLIPGWTFNDYCLVTEDRDAIASELHNHESVLLLENTRGLNQCDARFCILKSFDLPMQRQITSRCCFNLFDITGLRRVNYVVDGLDPDQRPLQPSRYFHISCIEVLVDLSTLVGAGQLKLEKKPCKDNPTQVHMFPKLIEDWLVVRGHFFSDLDINSYAQKYEDYRTVGGDGKQIHRIPLPEFPYPKRTLFSHMMLFAIGEPPKIDGVSWVIIEFLRQNPPTPDYKLYQAAKQDKIKEEPSKDLDETMQWVPEVFPFDRRDRRFAHRYYFCDPREKEKERELVFPQEDLRPVILEGGKWVFKEEGSVDESQHYYFTRGMTLDSYGVGALPDIG